MTDVSIDWNTGALNALLKGSSGEVARDIHRRAQNVEARARELAPKATRALVNSIHTEGPDLVNGELQESVVADADHAKYVEKGTRYMAAQPFLGPALSAVSS